MIHNTIMTKRPPALLITGASSGIGEACALSLAAEGYRVFAGTRSQTDAQTLQEKSAGHLTPVLLDVTDEAHIQEAYRQITLEKETYGSFCLLNNAGIAIGGPLAYMALSSLRTQLEVNLLGALRVTQVFLPLLRERQGRIVMMSSVAGQTVFPFLGPYCISKFGLEAASDALRLELQKWQIPVSLIQPGKIRTPIWQKSAQQAEALIAEGSPQALVDYAEEFQYLQGKASMQTTTGIDPQWVVRAVRHALTAQRPKTRYPVGMDSLLASYFRWLPDSWRDWGLLTRYRVALNKKGG